jgi:hypothetical protein
MAGLAAVVLNVCTAAPALISSDSGEVRAVITSGMVFSNRPFQFSEEAVRHLDGQPYLFKSNREALTIKVEKAGDLTVKLKENQRTGAQLRHQAEVLMGPFLQDRFLFTGV